MGEISQDELDQIRSKNVKQASAHGLIEIHEIFPNTPKFGLGADITESSHYLVEKYLGQLLYPLKMLILENSFEAVNHIQDIPPTLFENGYGLIWYQISLY